MRSLAFLIASGIVAGGAGATIAEATAPAAYPWIVAGWGVFCVAYAGIVAWRVLR